MYLEFECIDLGKHSRDCFECNYEFSGNIPGYDILLIKDDFYYEHLHHFNRGTLFTGDGGALEFTNAVVRNVEKAKSHYCAGESGCNLHDLLIELEPFNIRNCKNCLHIDLGVEDRVFTDKGGCDDDHDCESLESFRVIDKDARGNDLSKLKLLFSFNNNFCPEFQHYGGRLGDVSVQLLKVR